MVDLLVYTNHRMGDMYYNTPFPHNVLSIVTDLIFFLSHLFSEKSVFTTRYWWTCVISEVVFGSKCRCKEKGFVLDPVYVWQQCLLDPGTRPKETGILFWTYCFIGNRCSHIEGARHIAIPEVSLWRYCLNPFVEYSWWQRRLLAGIRSNSIVTVQVILQYPFVYPNRVQYVGLLSYDIAFHFWNQVVWHSI